MGISAFFCVFIGVNPAWLYQFMPFPVDYNAYSAGHLFWELQLLLFTGLGFFLMLKHLGGEAKLSVDTDWVYRKAGPVVIMAVGEWMRTTWRGFIAAMQGVLGGIWAGLKRLGSADGAFGRSWSIGQTTLWTVALMTLFGLVYLLR